jgi:RNA polymerase sigma factor FliA
MSTAPSSPHPTLPPPKRARVMMDVVNRIAHRFSRRAGPNVELDELIGAGGVGLAEAYTRRGGMTGKEFEAFASYRIQGAILDELRSMDPLSRKQRRMARAVAAAEVLESSRTGERPNDEQIAARLGIDSATLHELRGASAHRQSAMGELQEFANPLDPSPEDLFCKREQVSRALEIAETLPARQKLVLLECSIKDRSQKEVAEMLGVSPARVCQVLAEVGRSLARNASVNDARKECA